MTEDFDVKVNEYMPLRDVVFRTLRQAILKGRTGAGKAAHGNPAGKKPGRQPYADPRSHPGSWNWRDSSS
jgi:hypothetical protein